MPKFFIKTYGCQMNERDSEQVAHSLIARGYERVSLETGSGPAFDAAHALYIKRGFIPCGPFVGYVRDPFSRFFSLEL